jgi:hypothetical protein
MQDARVIVSSRLEKMSSETWGTVRWLYLSLLLHLIANGLLWLGTSSGALTALSWLV